MSNQTNERIEKLMTEISKDFAIRMLKHDISVEVVAACCELPIDVVKQLYEGVLWRREMMEKFAEEDEQH